MSYAKKLQFSPQGEYNEEASMTVPGQAYSLVELLERAISGQEVPTHEVSYDDNPDIDNPDPLNRMQCDIADVQPMLAELEAAQAAAAKAQKLAEARAMVAEAEAASAAASDPAPETPPE